MHTGIANDVMTGPAAEHAATTPDIRPAPMVVTIPVTDAEVVAELRRFSDGTDRERFAGAALRIGVLSLRTASGQVDAGALREAGQQLLGQVREVLMERGSEVTGQIRETLSRYFDPTSGALSQRMERLLQKDGDLARALEEHVGNDSSVMARTLAQHLGEDSPIFAMLSPSETTGLRAQLTQMLETALDEQRRKVIGQFSLDDPSSALSRLLQGVQSSNQALEVALQGQIDGVIKDFSSDDEDSAISRLSRLLESTSAQIGQNLTLDDEKSPLARLHKGLKGSLEDLVRRQTEFHTEVRTTLAALQARKEEAARSTRHGVSFEDQLGGLLLKESQRAGDVHESVGARPGATRAAKKGDFVTTLGPERPAPNARIVWEAKENAQYTLAKALEEIAEARVNREAQVGVFVFSAKVAPAELELVHRHGDDIVVVWDAEDPSSDLRVRLAYSLACSWVIRQRDATHDHDEALQQLEQSVQGIEKQLKFLGEFKKSGQIIQDRGEEIATRADKMRRELEKELENMNQQLDALRAPTDE
jgi:hypothetical protein